MRSAQPELTPEVTRLLIEHGALADPVADQKRIQEAFTSPLSIALIEHNVEAANKAIDEYSTKHLSEEDNKMINEALVIAAAQNRVTILHTILSRFSGSISNAALRTALIGAAFAGHVGPIDLILAAARRRPEPLNSLEWHNALNRAVFAAAIQHRIPVLELLVDRAFFLDIRIDLSDIGFAIKHILDQRHLEEADRGAYSQVFEILHRALLSFEAHRAVWGKNDPEEEKRKKKRKRKRKRNH